MGRVYTQYISKKLLDTRHVSDLENLAVWAADRCSTDDFTLIVIDGSDACSYHCRIDRNATPCRVGVDRVGDDVSCNLSEIYNDDVVAANAQGWNELFTLGADGKVLYDDYNDRFLEPENLREATAGAIAALDTMGAATVFVTGATTAHRPVLHALQQRFGTVIPIDGAAAAATVTRKRIATPTDLAEIPFNLNRSDYSARSVLNPEGAPVYVPLDDATLASPFHGSISWGDLLPNREPDTEIDGTPAKTLLFGLAMDMFGNVILNVFSSGKPSMRGVPLRLPFGGERPVPRPGQPKPQAQPKAQPHAQAKAPGQHKPQYSSMPLRYSAAAATNEQCSDPQKVFDGAFAFDKVDFPVARLMADIDKLSTKDLYTWRKRIEKVLERIFSAEIFLCDTNFWVQENPLRKGEMYYGWLIENFIKKFQTLPQKPKFEITNDVYDEIVRHAKTGVAASYNAKRMITDRLLGLGLAVTPGIRAELDRKAYADRTLMDRIKELYEEGARLTVLTNDTEAMYRWSANIPDEGVEGRHKPAFIRSVNLERLYRLRREIFTRISNLPKKSDQ